VSASALKVSVHAGSLPFSRKGYENNALLDRRSLDRAVSDCTSSSRGDWLEDEVRAWQQSDLDLVVSLLTPEEVTELDLNKEEGCCRAYGIQFHAFPITDMGVPVSRKASVALIRQLDNALTEGKSIVVHCRQGIGRSGLVAACLLMASGEIPETAFQRISTARGCPVPETMEQREWVHALATELWGFAPQKPPVRTT
jgi:predicted protein tyrosine phosphatase